MSFISRSIAFDLISIILGDGRTIYMREVRIDREKLLTTGDLILYGPDSGPEANPVGYFADGAWMGYVVGEVEEGEEG